MRVDIRYRVVPCKKHFPMTRSGHDSDGPQPDAGSARARILNAAFDVLRTRGYGATQTREIAARAKVSKRDIYREFGSKEGIFAALIAARSGLMRGPALEPKVASSVDLAETLRQVGIAFLQQLYDPAVVSVFRMAIASAEDSPGLAEILERNGFQPNRRALSELMGAAVEAGFLTGKTSDLAAQFGALLTGATHVPILLGIVPAPKPRERARLSAEATAAFLQLHGRAQGGVKVTT
jgi:AcrR family transcriptional regulator